MLLEIVSICVIVLSWWLNAVADAIDHGKGARSLYELWHIVKNISYALPFLWIAYLVKLNFWLIVIAGILLCGWYPIYKYLRKIDIGWYDDKFKIKWLQGIWGIKRNE